jgi:hypothetical protein
MKTLETGKIYRCLKDFLGAVKRDSFIPLSIYEEIDFEKHCWMTLVFKNNLLLVLEEVIEPKSELDYQTYKVLCEDKSFYITVTKHELNCFFIELE